jgi:hypothetical protein
MKFALVALGIAAVANAQVSEMGDMRGSSRQEERMARNVELSILLKS